METAHAVFDMLNSWEVPSWMWFGVAILAAIGLAGSLHSWYEDREV